MALSQSEAEEKEKQKLRSTSQILNKPASSPSNTKSVAPEELDPELVRYLDRGYWEQKEKEKAAEKAGNNSTAKILASTANIESDLTNQPKMVPKIGEKSDADLDEFVVTLKTQLEIFVNRMKSNSSRGRSITNDSSVQTLFMNTMAMHSKLLKHIQDQEDKRVYYEGLQDKLAQVKDARAALEALREEERERKRREQEEAERIKQNQMREKLELMRKKKTEYLQYQRQLALQKMQEQEREMMLRQEQSRQQYQQQQMYPGAPGAPGAPMYNPYYPGAPYMMPGMPPQAGMPPQPGMPPQAGMPPQTGIPPQVRRITLFFIKFHPTYFFFKAPGMAPPPPGSEASSFNMGSMGVALPSMYSSQPYMMPPHTQPQVTSAAGTQPHPEQVAPPPVTPQAPLPGAPPTTSTADALAELISFD